MRSLFVNCGDPDPSILAAHGPFFRWFQTALGPSVTLDEVDPRHRPVDLAQLNHVDSVIISGSSHSAYEPLEWISNLEAVAREAISVRKMPVLGVCFGHQVIANACGGRVVKNPLGREIGTVEILQSELGRSDALFGHLPERFDIQVTHKDTVSIAPPGARVLATSALDQCQAYAYESAWGVQFHPEITPEIIRGYLVARREIIASEGLDPDLLHAAVRPSSTGQQLFARFAEIVRSRS